MVRVRDKHLGLGFMYMHKYILRYGIMYNVLYDLRTNDNHEIIYFSILLLHGVINN